MSVLRVPSLELLPEYSAALGTGWSPNNLRPEAASEQLAQIEDDPVGFVARQTDIEAKGGPVLLPDGSTVPRLPSFRRWIFRGGFAGSIGLRWQPGTTELPPTCLGHVGYAVVPWRRREGLASTALIEILPEARALGLAHVDVTTDHDNQASAGVIEKAGGVLIGTFEAEAEVGGGQHLLFRIAL
ncbi:MAG: GNAT family N-acetyltransferase [Pseudomonadota bacterium]